jgi:hypothetical protein
VELGVRGARTKSLGSGSRSRLVRGFEISEGRGGSRGGGGGSAATPWLRRRRRRGWRRARKG